MFRLIKFGATSLTHYNQVDSMGSGETPLLYQSLPEGGALDAFGSQQKHPGTVEYTKTMRIKASSKTAIQDLYMGLLALRGKRDLLYRQLLGSGAQQWKYARLAEVVASREYQQAQFKWMQDVELRFVAQDVFWRGTAVGWTLDSGYFLDAGLNLDTGSSQSLTSSPKTFTITIGTDAGRAPIRAIILTVNPGNASMSNIKIARTNGETLTFSGTVAVGDRLVIDTGSMQVTNGGVDAYSSLALSPTADLATWLTLLTGANDFTVTWSGGGTGATLTFVYYESWY